VELLNNRYRVLREFDSMTFLVRDLVDHKHKIASIIDNEHIDRHLLDFYARAYGVYGNMRCVQIAKSLRFGIVKKIDGKKNSLPQFYMIAEYTGGGVFNENTANDLNESDILNLFADACRGAFYMHAKDMIHGSICFDTILIIKNDWEYNLKYKDPAAVELWRRSFGGGDVYFSAPEVVSEGKTGVLADVYALGVLLFCLLSKTVKSGRNFKHDYNAYKKKTNSEFAQKLMKLIGNMTCDAGKRYKTVPEALNAVNDAFGTDYAAFSRTELAHLSWNVPLVGRTEEYELISNIFDKIIAGRAEERCVRVHGVQGAGKTALLRELNNSMQLRGMSAYAAFGGDGSIKELVRQLLDDYEGSHKDSSNFIKQINAFAGRIVSGNSAEINSLSKNSLLKFIYDCIKDKPVVFFIDAMELAGADVFDTLEKLMQVNKKLMLVFTCRDGVANAALQAFIDKLGDNAADVNLSGLTEEETAQFIRSKLSHRRTPVIFAHHVYRTTMGNPLFTEEILGALQMSGDMFIGENGEWEVAYNTDEYGNIPMPSNIYGVAEEQARRLDPHSRSLLTAMSVFNIPVFASELAVCLGISVKSVAKTLNTVISIGAVREVATKKGTGYFFANKMLREYIYNTVEEESRQNLHSLAADALIRGKPGITPDTLICGEIIYQLENAGRIGETLLEHRLANARMLSRAADYEKSVENYEKVMEQSGETPEILLEIANTYILFGKRPVGREYFKRAAALAAAGNDPKYIVKIYGEMLFKLYDDVLDGAKEIFDKHPNLQEECLDSYLIMLREHAYCLEGTIDDRNAVMERACSLCPPERHDLMASLLLTWGHICYSAAKLDDAMRYWREARQNYMITGDPYGLAASASNVGEVYLALNDVEAAKLFLSEGLEYTNRHRFVLVEEHIREILLNCCIKGMEYENAIPLALEIASLEQMYSAATYRQAFMPYMFMDKYAEAYELAKVLDKHEGKFGISDFSEFFGAEATYWSNRARFAVYMGDDEGARTFIDREAKECEGGEISDYIPYLYVPFYQASAAMKAQDYIQIQESYGKIKDIADAHPGRQDILNLVCEFLILLHNGGGLECIGEALSAEIARGSSGKPAPIVRAKLGFLQSLTQTGEARLNTLTEARETARSSGQPLTLALICGALGRHYENENSYLSMYYYIEACLTVQRLVKNVPEEFKESFVRRHNLLAPFEMIMGGECKTGGTLGQIYSKDLYNRVLADEGLMASARKTHFERLPADIINPVDVIRGMGGDAAGNLNLLARYLAAITCAARCEMLIEDENGNSGGFAVIMSDDGNMDSQADIQILRRANALGAEILVTGGEAVTGAAMCLPVVLDGAARGFVYLYADSVIHNLNKDSLNECKLFAKLLAANINQLAIKTSSTIDKLTGALNRTAFDLEFDRRIEKAGKDGGVFSIIMSDLDRFKNINDTYGHQIGDDVLRAAGRLIRANLNNNEIFGRYGDGVFGRYGGEEFVIIIDGAGPESALELAERLRVAIDDAKLLGSRRPVTASMGVAVYGTHDITKEGLMDKADKALYVCKEQGRNQSMVYNPELMGKAKSVNTVGGIITGDTIKDGRRMRAVLDMIELVGQGLSFSAKAEIILAKITEMTEAESICLLMIENGVLTGEIGQHGKGGYDKNLAAAAIRTGESLYQTAEGNSSVCIPIYMDNIIKRALYLSTPAAKKEYKHADISFINYLCGFVTAI